MEFHNFFEDHPNGDEELRGIDPNNCNVKRTDAFLKGIYASSNFDLKDNLTGFVIMSSQNNGFATKPF